MANIDFTIDTSPMAQKMDGVTTSVGVVGAAVGAMQAAVIASEKKASDKVCKSIDNGFYMLMRSRLSQRIAQFASTMNSRAGSMLETSNAIEHTHVQMEGDFMRIKARYTKLFDALDRTLEQRVRELDQDAMSLAQRRDELVANQQCRNAPSALYYTGDISGVALKTSNARLKQKAHASIVQLSEGARCVLDYERMSSSIMGTVPNAGSPFCYLPVVYAMSENLAVQDTYAFEVQTPAGIDPKTQAEAARGVMDNQDKLRGSSEKDLMATRERFARKVAVSGADARVQQTMLNLFDASFFPQAPGQQAGQPATQAGQPGQPHAPQAPGVGGGAL